MSALLFGPDGRPVFVGDAPADDLPSMLERYAITTAHAADDVMARAVSLITVGLMLLNGFGDGPELADIVNECENTAAALGPAMRCRLCRCTALSPCHVHGTPCHWVAAFLCSACAPTAAAAAVGTEVAA